MPKRYLSTCIHNGGCHEPTPFALHCARIGTASGRRSKDLLFFLVWGVSPRSGFILCICLFVCYISYIFSHILHILRTYISMNILHARTMLAGLTCLTFDDFVQDYKFPRWDAYVHLSCTNGRLESKSAFGQMPISDLLPPKWWMVMVSRNSKLLVFI